MEVNAVLRVVVVRILSGFVTVLFASLLIFMTVELLPGDAATVYLGRDAKSDPVALEQLRNEYGLNRNLSIRYCDWVVGALQFDFGRSFVSQQSVSSLISPRLNRTALLLGISLAFMFPLSVLVGAVSALKRGTLVDSAIQTGNLISASLPTFVSGIALIFLFSFIWPIFPAVSLVLTPKSLVLPVLVLILGWMPFTVRMVRSGIVNVMDSNYVELARLKGLPSARVFRSHILPNAMVPAIQAFALTAASMPAGIVVVEYLFGFQGIGVFLIDAVRARDTPTVQAVTLILVALYIVANLISDLLAIILTPRLRTEVMG